MFGGYDFEDLNLDSNEVLSEAYRRGVSMGSELLVKSEGSPRFLAWATKDTTSASLQRIQIIKGWTQNGQHNEQVYDVACANGAKVDPMTHRCPDNGASVDLTDCSISVQEGGAELKVLWEDPEFDPAIRSFYYVRALENPTCRWSTWDALKAGASPRSDLKKTIQERAWSSAIWTIPIS